MSTVWKIKVTYTVSGTVTLKIVFWLTTISLLVDKFIMLQYLTIYSAHY